MFRNRPLSALKTPTLRHNDRVNIFYAKLRTWSQGWAMWYKKTRRRKEYREKNHRTGEREEWKLNEPPPNTEKALRIVIFYVLYSVLHNINIKYKLFIKLNTHPYMGDPASVRLSRVCRTGIVAITWPLKTCWSRESRAYLSRCASS